MVARKLGAATLKLAPLLLMLVCLAPSLSMAEPSTLSVSAPIGGTIQPSARAEFALAVHAGDFVQGRIESSAGAVELDLVTVSGTHIRRLAAAGSANQDFMFVAEQDAPRLRLRSLGPQQSYTLTLTQAVGRDAQHPPAPTRASFLSPRMANLAESLTAGGTSEEFWQAVEAEGTPLVEPGDGSNKIVTFLWRGAERNVRLFGAPSNDHEWLERLGKSDVWYKSFEVPAATRLSYKLAPDIPDVPGSERDRRRALLATAQVDPLNKHAWPVAAPDKFNQDSVVELPDAPPQPWIGELGAPKGRLEAHRFASKILGNERDVFIYTSQGFSPDDPGQGLLLLFDAQPYLDKVPTPTILDNLVAAGKIPPLVAVLIGNPSQEARERELPCNAAFADALATELVPWVKAKTGAAVPAARTVAAGSSYGGLASAYAAFRHPEVFGNVLSMSGSFWWKPETENEPEWLTRQIAAGALTPVSSFLSAGLFEAGRDQPGILETTRHLRDVLTAKGAAVSYREYAAGHDYLSWRGVLADGLVTLLGVKEPVVLRRSQQLLQ
jgi:enterochelin esterase family protein